MKILFRTLGLLLLVCLFSCSSSPRFTNEESVNEEETQNRSPDENTEDGNVLETVTGVASYYADKYHGRLTANGETYDMYGLTAAHPDYPFETILRVTNTKNSRTVVIRINDRMPRHPDRIIDLSYGTADELDMLTDGIVKVKLEILKWGEK